MIMDQTINSLLNRVVNLTHAESREAERSNDFKKKKKWLKKEGRDEAGEHYDELSEATDRLNSHLVQKKSPYRVELFGIDNEIYIKLIVSNNIGEVIDEKVINITHFEFTEFLSQILNREGVLLDIKG